MRKASRRRMVLIVSVLFALLLLLRLAVRRGELLPALEILGAEGKARAGDVVAPPLDQGQRKRILAAARALVTGGVPGELGDADEPGRRLVVLSLGRATLPALVAHGEGSSLGAALQQAASTLAARATAAEVAAGRLKVDVVTALGEPAEIAAGRRVELEPSLEGLWLPDASLLLLPEELMARRLVRRKGELHVGRLHAYLTSGNHLVADTPAAAAFTPASLAPGHPYQRVALDSFMEGSGELPVRLYRGNDREPEVSPPALLAAARQGGDYLVRHTFDDGLFGYSYEPQKDAYDDSYNLLRHAGTAYALLELYQATGEARFLDTARRTLEALLRHARGPRAEDAAAQFEAIVSPGEEAKLGGAALAVLALVEHQRATGDDRWLAAAQRQARFLVFQQEANGHFLSKYFYGQPDPEPFESIYYPGEAILALARLYRVDPQPVWLATARRGADWLIDVRDAGKPAVDLPHDHWLLIGLDELYDLTGDARYVEHARRIGDAIVAAQRTSAEPLDWMGSYYDPPRSTPVATRAEGLVAMHRLALRSDIDPRPYREALLRMAVFQLRCQLGPENVLYLPRPDRALGGFRRSLTDWEVRIDYVQHNLSALLGLREILLS